MTASVPGAAHAPRYEPVAVNQLVVRTRLGPYRAKWDQLVLDHYPPSLHLRSWWLEGVAAAGSRFLLVVEGQRLLGGLALDTRKVLGGRVTIVELLGGRALGPLHGDLLAVAGSEDAVVTRLRDWFRSHPQCVVDLDGVRSNPSLTRVLPPHARTTLTDEAPFVMLPGTFEEYLRGRSRNWRSNLRRNERRLEGDGYVHRRLRTDESRLALESLRRLHEQRHGQRSGFLPHFERFAVAARAGVHGGELAFQVIADGDDVVAVDVVLQVGEHATYFQGGRNTRDERFQGAGLVLLANIIEDACARGLRELDLEVSADEYKLRMTDDLRPVHRLVAVWGVEAQWYICALRARRALRTLSKLSTKASRRLLRVLAARFGVAMGKG